MIRHLLKLVWNRKRSTALLILEITCAFLVLFAVATSVVFFLDGYTEPIGFEYEDVWTIAIDLKAGMDGKLTDEQTGRLQRLLREAQSTDGVEAAAFGVIPPYTSGGMSDGRNMGGRKVYLHFGEVSDEFADVMNLQIVSGRWFEPADAALDWKPVVIDQDAAEAIFGTEDPLGKVLDKDASPPSRVIGVIAEYREDGELSGDTNFVFGRTNPASQWPARNMFVRLRPGIGADFEEHLQRRLAPVAGDWSLEIRSLAEMRRSMQRLQLTPVVIGGVIALFLVLMVILGLSGVLWQNVTQRHSELGLRRAAGATASQVRRQILIELALVTSLGILAGLLIVIQLPILGILSVMQVPTTIFAAGVAVAVALMFFFTWLCGIYPSWLATTIEPADALRAE